MKEFYEQYIRGVALFYVWIFIMFYHNYIDDDIGGLIYGKNNEQNGNKDIDGLEVA